MKNYDRVTDIGLGCFTFWESGFWLLAIETMREIVETLRTVPIPCIYCPPSGRGIPIQKDYGQKICENCGDARGEKNCAACGVTFYW